MPTQYNLKINPCKCDFFKTKITFLGHRCSEKGILPDSFKLKVIHEYSEPTEKEAVQRVLLSRWINYSAEKSDFIWNTEFKQAFIQLENATVAPQLLAYSDFNNKFIITVGLRSRFEIDLHLEHLQKVNATNRLLSCNYWLSTSPFNLILTNEKQFDFRSDNKPLIYLLNLKNPSSRLLRIILELEE